MRPPDVERRPLVRAAVTGNRMSTPLARQRSATRGLHNDNGPTARYLLDRERILGSFRVHGDPIVASEMLLDAFGDIYAARSWIFAVLDELAATKARPS